MTVIGTALRRPWLSRLVRRGSGWLRGLATLGLLGFLAVLAVLAYDWAWRWAGQRLLHEARDRLALYESSLDAAVERFRYLPEVIALADPIRALLEHPSDATRVQGANAHLLAVTRAAGADVLFVMDAEGLTLASSNAGEPVSFVGQRYDFRPYFQDAMRDGAGRFYAVGATTGKPGYFLASRIDGPRGPRGVAVVKVDLAPMQIEWRKAREPVALVDGQGIILLASDPDWLYRPLLALPPAILKALELSRTYGSPLRLGPPLTRARRERRGLPMVEMALGDGRFALGFDLQRDLSAHGWTILHILPEQGARTMARAAAAGAIIASLAALLGALMVRQRRAHARSRQRAHAELEMRVEARTRDLADMNTQLRDEVRERIRTEKALRQAQDGLVQSAKLAGLGQGLTGIAHEMAQPLAALRTALATLRHHVSAADATRALATTADLDAIANRVEALARQLRNFARPDVEKPRATSLQALLAGALSIMDHRLRGSGIAVIQDWPDQPLMVDVRVNRLEQVIVNLIANALDSIEDANREIPSPRSIRLVLTMGEGCVRLGVEDDGLGLGNEPAERLFEPFVSTKAAGRGLGLGLSISRAICREHGGDLTLKSRETGGAVAILSLPAAHTSRQVA